MTDTGGFLGHATLQPTAEVVAGSFGTWTITYTVGKYGIDDLGSILIARRTASDSGIPQFDRPTESNFTAVTATGQAKVKAWYDPYAYVRPWKAAVVVRVFDGSLALGDQIQITFGDRSEGSPGYQMQTFAQEIFEFRLVVDCFGTGQFVRVPQPPVLRIVGGPADRLRIAAPSHTTVGEPFAAIVKVEDLWGNASAEYAGLLEIESDDPGAVLPSACWCTTADGSAYRFDGITLKDPGVRRLVVRDQASGLVAESNPILCSSSPPALKLYWGDIHGQTAATVGTGTLDQYFRYGRDVAGLDFIAHCGNDFQITEEHYAETQEVVKRYHQPGRFVTYLAYEWSGNTPAGGDHNVYFLHDGQPIHRSSHWQISDRSDQDTDRYPISSLFETFRGRKDVLVIPHIGGRPANLDYHDPELTPVIEIQSAHGVFYWLAEEALERGLRVGFVASSDDHSGRPGSSPPYRGSSHFGSPGGLIAIYAPELTRSALWDAIKRRRCYGTTGERIILSVSADGHPMGEEYRPKGQPRVAVNVEGTAPTGARRPVPWSRAYLSASAGRGRDRTPTSDSLEWRSGEGPEPTYSMGWYHYPHGRQHTRGQRICLRSARRGTGRDRRSAGELAIDNLWRPRRSLP